MTLTRKSTLSATQKCLLIVSVSAVALVGAMVVATPAAAQMTAGESSSVSSQMSSLAQTQSNTNVSLVNVTTSLGGRVELGLLPDELSRPDAVQYQRLAGQRDHVAGRESRARSPPR